MGLDMQKVMGIINKADEVPLGNFGLFVLYVFIFMFGMILGWCIEVIYRHFADKEKRWFNPGFCVGPWLPIYGFALLIIFTVCLVDRLFPSQGSFTIHQLVLFIIMSLLITLMELVGGSILKNTLNVRLWDYTNEWMNYKGYICPKFTFFWVILAAVYYFLLHYRIYYLVSLLALHIEFSFIVGFFFSIFIMDLLYSANVAKKAVDVAKNEAKVVVNLEALKERLRREKAIRDAKLAFFAFTEKEKITKDIVRKSEAVKEVMNKVKNKVKEAEDEVKNVKKKIKNKK